MRHVLTLVASTAALMFGISGSASALTAKECSVKYQEAKTAGTLGSMKWNDFRKAQCGDSASAAPAPAPPSTTTVPNPLKPTPAPASTTAARPTPAPAPAARPAPAPAPTAPAPAAAGPAIFPRTVSAKYSSESAGKARMHTCLDQYNTNKASGGTANGGMNWIARGGGYYSECNKRLKV